MEIRVLMASYNRRDLTVRAIAAVLRAAQVADVDAHIWLFDDGSRDGTAAEVSRQFGDRVSVVHGDGSAYWAKSMAGAEAAALKENASVDTSLLWLNDDVTLDDDALVRLSAAAELMPRRILIGSMRDRTLGTLTYGGLKRRGPHPLSFDLVEPGPDPTEVDTMNGNLVLVPLQVARVIGGIDGRFSHAWADVDYGMRSTAIGLPPVLLAGTYGTCDRNETPPTRGLLADWTAFISVKGGGNPSSTRRILRRVAPLSWPIWWTGSYVKWWIRRVVHRSVN